MTEPLIAIEGKLRLPPLRPLADPSLTFGREWSPVRTRPAQSDSEFSISAARFETAYVEAAHLSDAGSPYRAASLWGVFSEGQIRRKMLQLMQAADSAMPRQEALADVTPIPVAVSAPTPEQGRSGFLHTPLRTAIAIACAALIAWLLFGYKQRPASEEPAAALTAAHAQATPAETVETTPIVAQGASGVEAKVTTVSTQSKPVSSEQPASLTSANDERGASHVGAQPAASSVAVRHARMKPRSEASVAETVARTKVNRAHAHARVAATVAHAKHASHIAASHGTRTTAQHTGAGPSASANAMNVEALYAVLQHSPTLDSNVTSPREHR
ncbi:hypothetical protein P9239_08265 [Caballeronia sp. LZ062]|uniref:hypothetical protein n=1 Tax=unclassified Caballeronia TaxID=2646786 RepID=UPI0028557E22|nr:MULTISPECIES: hypothetical protein [unclassified Caballeronia]MDR5855119.1 hypothetical protein [Caballeronia sp. LZ050]MDR5870351.1 hypothetical protein [Caballeronia sp. LZ062]